MDRERVDTGIEFAGKRLVDHAMTREPALPPERLSHDMDPEMRFSPRPMAAMAFMAMGFVEHLQAQRREGFGQLPGNGFLHTHRASHAKSINGGFTIASIRRPGVDANMSHEICQACATP